MRLSNFTAKRRCAVLQCIRHLKYTAALILVAALAYGAPDNPPAEQMTFTVDVPTLPAIDIQDPQRFRNDLMLSPFWYVVKEKTNLWSSGEFVAYARSLQDVFPFSRQLPQFLFEPVLTSPKEADHHIDSIFGTLGNVARGFYSFCPGETVICNRGLSTRGIANPVFNTLSASIVFAKPPDSFVLATSGQTVSVQKHRQFFGFLPTALAFKISAKHDIYLLVKEHGKDNTSATTKEKLPVIFRELQRLAALPETYRAEQCYADFFKMFFDLPLKDSDLKRLPGPISQGLDAFYGYFRAKPGISYAGVNIKISHAEYCPNEGTRQAERLRKAEYLGTPYEAGDILFFHIEDNATYLSEQYTKRFGWANGKEAFDGTLEILNDKADVLLKTTQPFRSWER